MNKTFLISTLIIVFLLTTLTPAISAADEGVNYVLIFQVTEYNSKIGDAAEYFFKSMLNPQDNLFLLSPTQLYNFSAQMRQKYKLPDLISQTEKVLKKDSTMAAANYDQVLNAMTQVVTEISNGTDSASGGMGGGVQTGTDIKQFMVQYRQLMENLRQLRKLNENFFIDMANKLKALPGKTYFYVIYEKELKYTPTRGAIDNLRQNPRYKFDAAELFEAESSEKIMDTDKVLQAFKDASISFNFIYLNKQEKRRQGMEIKEFSGDVYNVFATLANGTGGFVESTSKPEAALKKAGRPQ